MYQFTNLFYSSPRYSSLRCSTYTYLNIFREPLRLNIIQPASKLCVLLSCAFEPAQLSKYSTSKKKDHTKLVLFDIAHTQFGSSISVAEVLAY